MTFGGESKIRGLQPYRLFRIQISDNGPEGEWQLLDSKTRGKTIPGHSARYSAFAVHYTWSEKVDRDDQVRRRIRRDDGDVDDGQLINRSSVAREDRGDLSTTQDTRPDDVAREMIDNETEQIRDGIGGSGRDGGQTLVFIHGGWRGDDSHCSRQENLFALICNSSNDSYHWKRLNLPSYSALPHLTGHNLIFRYIPETDRKQLYLMGGCGVGVRTRSTQLSHEADGQVTYLEFQSSSCCSLF